MRVLLVCHGYPPFGVAGVERIAAQTAEGLTERGHAVTVLTRRASVAPPTLALERDRRNDVPVVTIAGAGPTYEDFPGHEPGLERAFERMLAEVDPDVVLLTHLLHHSPGYVGIAHRWGVPVVLELHDFYMRCQRAHLLRRSGERCGGPEGGVACAVHCFGHQPHALARWSLRTRAFADAVRAADVVLGPSCFVAEAFAPLRGEAAPVRVVPNGIAPLGPAVRPPADEHVPLHLASIGVTVEHKGFHVVVQALRGARLPAARYTIFGLAIEPEAGRLRELAADVPGLELRLFGGFEPALLPALLADVDAAIVPSLVAETYSIVAREAFACGVPVLASRIGALPEAVREPENGLLFAPGDAAELAVLLQRLDGDRPLLRTLADGIGPQDHPPVGSRVAALERILAEAVVAGVAPVAHASGEELRLLRETIGAR